jgi:hypothetical protein
MSAILITPVLAESTGYQSNVLCAASPHYYGEPGQKTSEWYYNHRTVVGDVLTWVDANVLYILFKTDAQFSLAETHVGVFLKANDIPQTRSGNPKVGNFPYQHEDLSDTWDRYAIPFASLGISPGTTVVISAHAIVNGPNGQETAWGDCGGPNAYFRGNNWATYFTYPNT